MRYQVWFFVSAGTGATTVATAAVGADFIEAPFRGTTTFREPSTALFKAALGVDVEVVRTDFVVILFCFFSAIRSRNLWLLYRLWCKIELQMLVCNDLSWMICHRPN